MSRRHFARAPGCAARLFVTVLAVAALAGCTALRPIPPEVSLVSLELGDVTLFETSGTFTVRLANENPEPLAVEGGAYNLYLGGLKVGKGLSDQRIEVPALGTATVEVELFINNLAVATRLRSMFETGVVDYRIKAKIYLRGAYGRRALTVDREGSFDLDGREPSPDAGDGR